MYDIRSILKYLPESIRDRSERTAFCALAASISVVLVSIAASQILLAVTIAGFVWMRRTHKDLIPMRMRSLLPLVAFMAWTLIAVFASRNIILGLEISKKFYLYLLVPMVPLIVRGRDRVKWIYRAIFLFAIISSLRGLAQFAANPHRDLLHRISGFMSQWMTYSGLLMLALILLTAYALIDGIRKNKWTIPAAACIALAIVFSQTRNAWLGAIAGITLLVLLWRPRAFILLCAAILACYSFSPEIRERVKSGFDPNDPNTRNRIELFQTSTRLIHDHPWLGVGPKNVKYEALKYRGQNEFPDWMYQHMHNNFLQIAAEAGIPGLLIWLWFMGRIGWDALACYRFAKSRSFPYEEELRKEALMASSAALAAWLALMLAGMFEYNFGDSEVLTLFLFIMSAPYAFIGLRVHGLTGLRVSGSQSEQEIPKPVNP
jgi:putative inorganic carbon (hco3(-)) transporter